MREGRLWGRGALPFFLLLLCALMLSCCSQPQSQPEEHPVEEPPSTEEDEKAILEATEEAIAGIEVETELEEHLLARFECELGEVDVEGNRATLEAHVSNADLPTALSEALGEFSDNEDIISSLGELYREGTDEELTDAFLDVLYGHVDECEDVVETDVTLRYTKRENEWTLDESSLEQFVAAAYAGLEY